MIADDVLNLLDGYHHSTLMEMAEAAGLDVRPAGKKLNKGDLLALMRREFFDEQRIHAALQKLDEREQAVLNRLLLRGGRVASRTFQRELVRARLVTPAPAVKQPHDGRPAYEGDPQRHSAVFEDVMARLTYHGLVFSSSGHDYGSGPAPKLQFTPATTLYIPLVVRRYLPTPAPIPAPHEWQPAQIRQGDATLFLRDLYLYWDTVRRTPVPLVQGGLVGKRSLKTMNDSLLVADPLLAQAKRESDTGRLYLLRLLLEQLKLVQSSQSQLRPVGKDTEVIPGFWQQPPALQLRRCLELWSLLPQTNEVDEESRPYRPQPEMARPLLVESLAEMPAGLWIEQEELVEHLCNRNINFLFPFHSEVENRRGGYGSHYYYYAGGIAYYGQPEALLQKLEQWETRFVARSLAGFLCDLGLVELGYDQPAAEPAGWLAFRLTALGRAVLAGEPAPEPARAEVNSGRVVIQPNFQILAIGPVGLDILARLDRLAQRQQADQAVFAYLLTREATYAALQQGMATGQLIEELEAVSAARLPQNVRRSLEEWGAHHERIVFRTGMSLLQAADAGLLDRLQAAAATSKLLGRRLTPDVALVKKGKKKALVSALLAEGMLPADSGANPQSADGSVVIQIDGLVEPVYPLPSLYLRGRLARLAEAGQGQSWRITPHSIRQAGGSKPKVKLILAELGRLNQGELPAALVAAIKKWGGYYGQAGIATVTLLEFSDEETLAELLAQPQLRPHLQPFATPGRALAVVAADRLELVKQVLAELGVEVRDTLAW